MDVEYCLEGDESQKITKDNGRCSYSTDMAKDIVMEDLPGSANDEEDEDVADLSDLEDVEVQRQRLNAKLEFLDVMLQRVKEEERLRLASGLPAHSSSNLLRKCGWNQLDSHYHENLANPVSNFLSEDGSFEKSFPLLGYGQIEDNTLENLNLDCSYPSIKTGKDSSRSPPPQTVIPKADPDAAKCDFSLDNLTIKELHETFKATFGRETSVKDKQWLKRRISIGTNVSKKTNKKEKINSRSGKSLVQQFPDDSEKVQVIKSEVVVDGSVEVAARKRPLGRDSSTTLFTDFVPKTEFELSNDEVPLGEETVGKRMRKPTRRYIEELSDVDSRLNSGKPAVVERDSDQGYTPVKSHARPYWNEFERMALVFRQDSLGGCGIQVPFVLRVRRGRPRKNCSSLLKNKSSGRATNLVRKELHVQPAQYSGDTADMKQIVPFGSSQKADLHKSKSSGRDGNLVKQALCVQTAHYSGDTANMKQTVPFGSSQNVVHDNNEIKEQALVSVPPDRNYSLETSNSDSVDDISYDYLKTIRTAKGGIRRKHHRSWTLHEVVKLVDGVSHFGVGRWSDIKKLAFSSSGYRTSVDLKDKWRNLLRASYAQLQTNKQSVNRRNHASVPIPAHILGRVRELAASQSRAICTPSSNSSLSRSGRTVQKRHMM